MEKIVTRNCHENTAAQAEKDTTITFQQIKNKEPCGIKKQEISHRLIEAIIMRSSKDNFSHDQDTPQQPALYILSPTSFGSVSASTLYNCLQDREICVRTLFG